MIGANDTDVERDARVMEVLRNAASLAAELGAVGGMEIAHTVCLALAGGLDGTPSGEFDLLAERLMDFAREAFRGHNASAPNVGSLRFAAEALGIASEALALYCNHAGRPSVDGSETP